MNMWRVGEDLGSKETDGCPLTGGRGNSKDGSNDGDSSGGISEGMLVHK
jgi:hypothetical protein